MKQEYSAIDDDLKRVSGARNVTFQPTKHYTNSIVVFLIWLTVMAFLDIGSPTSPAFTIIFGILFVPIAGTLWYAYVASDSPNVRLFAWFWLGSDFVVLLLHKIGISPVLQFIVFGVILLLSIKPFRQQDVNRRLDEYDAFYAEEKLKEEIRRNDRNV